MRNSTKLFSSIAVAGLVAAGGSAFTASSTIDEAHKTVGATSQTISGVNVGNVGYTWDATAGTTSAVDFDIDSALGTNDALTVELDGTGSTCESSALGLHYACTFTAPVADALSQTLSIVVN